MKDHWRSLTQELCPRESTMSDLNQSDLLFCVVDIEMQMLEAKDRLRNWMNIQRVTGHRGLKPQGSSKQKQQKQYSEKSLKRLAASRRSKRIKERNKLSLQTDKELKSFWCWKHDNITQ